MTDKTVCSKSGCTEDSVIKQGRQNLCPKHYRFGQMKALAKRRGLAAPSHELLHNLLNEEMKCPDCGVAMNWRSKDGMASVASLQHYRDGTFGIVCRSCNTRTNVIGTSPLRTLLSSEIYKMDALETLNQVLMISPYLGKKIT